MSNMRHGSLFSGIGGFDLAAEWMGWENVFHCEINDFCKKVLNYYWPDAKSYSDITTTDFTVHRGSIDIVSGGFPCQPYSLTGKRKGKADDRHLWPQMLRAIREIQPRWVVGENVPGLLNWNRGVVLDEIKADLETEGFEVFPPLVLPAAGKDAPHRRDRVWIVAHSNDEQRERKKRGFQSEFNDGDKSTISDTESKRIGGLSIQQWAERKESIDINRNNKERIITNNNNKGLQGGEINGGTRKIRPQRNEQPSGLFQSTWENFPTQSPLCIRDDGLSSKLDGITFSKHRNESIKAAGNAIVPQVAYEIFKAIEAVDKK